MTFDNKKLAAEAAVAEVRDGMVVGLGTGSTAAFAIDAIGRRVAQGLRVTAVATSVASAEQARRLNIPLLDFADVARVDLTIDGTDEIDGALVAVKGAGGAMLREKAVAAASTRMVVIADGSKQVERLGAAKLPVEVLPFARAFVLSRLVELFDRVELRDAGSYRTDNDNVVADCHDAQVSDPGVLAAVLQAIPGVVGHGLFLDEVDAAYIATDGVVARVERGG
ncbi:ribose-5-phosphate isomerase RpiA [Sphingomonas sp.]|jgi:ribose 5-phosphate isomerase A|uniref:ribose-5-phosphate isomerase RpiA n=1 Tax=Sphingomonas sp. TaxID=28214 RepID=UPI002D7EFE8B|nr:ribose-5-phosphate isomerase RpiA [Sphingomonas sp.]HEU0044356.1 ribose-5-phosphate isomerase RpiA [Sphingomonas sp.]